MELLEASAQRWAEHHGTEPITLIRNARGGDKMLQALQLEALAQWAASLADKLNPPVVVEASEAVDPQPAPTPVPRKGRK